MKGEVVNLNRSRWLALANQAVGAANTLDAEAVKALGDTAGRMQAATPPATDPVAMTACLALRWACQHFAFVTPSVRPALAPGLIVYAGEIRRIFEYTPPPREAVAQPVPVQPELPEPANLPSWTARADCGT